MSQQACAAPGARSSLACSSTPPRSQPFTIAVDPMPSPSCTCSVGAPKCSFPEPRIEAHSPLFATLVLSVTHPDKPTSRSTRWHVEMRTTGPPAATRCLDVPPLLPSHSPTALSGRHGSGSLSLPPNPGTSRSRQAVRPGRRASAPQVAERRERRSRRRERRASALSRVCTRARGASGRPFAGRCARWRERLRVRPVCVRSCASRSARYCIALCVSPLLCARDACIGRVDRSLVDAVWCAVRDRRDS